MQLKQINEVCIPEYAGVSRSIPEYALLNILLALKVAKSTNMDKIIIDRISLYFLKKNKLEKCVPLASMEQFYQKISNTFQYSLS